MTEEEARKMMRMREEALRCRDVDALRERIVQAEMMRMREEALRSGDVDMLREYLVLAGEEEAAEVEDEVLTIALHKARVHWRGCPPGTLYESVWWLHDHGYSLNYDNM